MKSIEFLGFTLSPEYQDPKSMKEMISKDPNKKQYEELYAKYPDDFARLYQIKDKIKLKNKDNLVISADQQGQPALLLKGFEKDFVIRSEKTDGGEIKTSVIGDKLVDKIAESGTNIKGFCEQMEATGIDLSTMASNDEKLARLIEEMQKMLNNGTLTPDQLKDFGDQARGINAKSVVFNDAYSAMAKAIDANMGKVVKKSRGFGVFDTVYNLYDEDPDARSLKEKIDKGRVIPDARLYVKQFPGKPASFKYHIKNNGKVSDDIAKTLAAAIKSTGHAYMNISGVLPKDRGPIQKELAKKGIVPTGVDFSVQDMKELLEEAQKKMGADEYKKFQKKFIRRMEKQYSGRMNSDLKEYFVGQESEIRNNTLKDAWDNGGLKDLLPVGRELGDAEKSIAAISSVNRVLKSYQNSRSIAHLITSAKDPMEKEALLKHFDGRLESAVETMSAEDMKFMFGVFMRRETVDAENRLMEQYKLAVLPGPKRSQNTYVADVWKSAKKDLDNTIDNLKSKGHCELSLPKMEPPTSYKPGSEFLKQHEKDEAEKKKREEEKNKQEEANNSSTPKAPIIPTPTRNQGR